MKEMLRNGYLVTSEYLNRLRNERSKGSLTVLGVLHEECEPLKDLARARAYFEDAVMKGGKIAATRLASLLNSHYQELGENREAVAKRTRNELLDTGFDGALVVKGNMCLNGNPSYDRNKEEAKECYRQAS